MRGTVTDGDRVYDFMRVKIFEHFCYVFSASAKMKTISIFGERANM